MFRSKFRGRSVVDRIRGPVGPRIANRRTVDRRRWLLLGSLAACLGLGLACTPQALTDQPKLRPLGASSFYPNDSSARPLEPDTVPRGGVANDPYLETGKTADGKDGDVFPEPVTMEMLERGQSKFNTYCAPCHGERGMGAGLVAQRGFPGVVGYHDDRLRNIAPGYIFNFMTHGSQKMPPYGYLIDPHDRWAIVAYIRALQLSRNASLNDVPADERAKLEAEEKQ